MSRKPGNYIFTTLFPIILSSFLMTVTNLIPLKTGERVVSGFLVLVINSILLTIFIQQIPNIATTTAILGIYLIGNLCIDFFRMFITVAMAKMHHKSEKYTAVGEKVTKIALIVKRVMCFKDKPVESDRLSLLSIPTDDLKKISKTLSPKKNMVAPDDANTNFTETVKVKESALPVLSSRYEVDLRTVRARQVEKMEEKMVDDNYLTNNFDDTKLTWDAVATIFDRLWFIMFLITKIMFNAVLIGNLFYETQ
ncbi:5-hydroxytryptamine receptor 3A-like [Ruditapes philippinarum]|uniref:5-hydroxytryptamine receptor 3A-like n=1 Tax=Ruditapes philippinarum TaxID=129788 RepID=UPI00295BA81A|nr:5-hydroxytryptamine receptor 3A-like [Ruditapes philippinarum]